MKCNRELPDGTLCKNTKPYGYKRCYTCAVIFVRDSHVKRFYTHRTNKDIILDLQA